MNILYIFNKIKLKFAIYLALSSYLRTDRMKQFFQEEDAEGRIYPDLCDFLSFIKRMLG